MKKGHDICFITDYWNKIIGMCFMLSLQEYKACISIFSIDSNISIYQGKCKPVFSNRYNIISAHLMQFESQMPVRLDRAWMKKITERNDKICSQRNSEVSLTSMKTIGISYF